jgi:DeoR/GlpR family transcriptional regulator of sugar metabolism
MGEKTQKELAPQRLDRVRQIIRRKGVVRIGELSRKSGVSEATIRRDLNHLESLGEVRRVHGGVVGIESRLEEPLFDDKASFRVDEKRRIAETALSYVEPGDTIYLDGGSTVLELVRLMRDRGNACIVTNSIRALLELAARGPAVIFIGGELRRLSQTTVGSMTRLILEQIHVDKAFMGTMGLTLEEGLTTTDPGEAFTKELVMKQARQVYLLSDTSKIGKVSFVRAGRLEDVDVLITDGALDRDFSRKLGQLGVETVLC